VVWGCFQRAHKSSTTAHCYRTRPRIKMSSVPGARAGVPGSDRPPQPSAGFGQVHLLQEGEADARVRRRDVRLERAARAWVWACV